MDKKPNFEMNRNLLQHFDDAVNDIYASFKDSAEMDTLKKLDMRYSNKTPVAEGGMKKIYKCTDLYTERDIALALPKKGSSAEQINLFIREAKITASLQHPNIVPVYELGLEDEKPFFTMKYLQGTNLAEFLRSSKCSTDELLEIFLKVCDATAYAHSKGILHLDIKPENIYLDGFGDVLLCDWGLAKNTTDNAVENSVAGTPGFMSPEQCNGKALTESSDIFSLGALLYFMLTGNCCVNGNTSEEIHRNTANGYFTLIESGSIHKSILAILKKSINLKAENRYHSVLELASEIKNYMNGFATKAEQAGLTTILILLFKRYRPTCITILISLLAITVLTAYFISSLSTEKQSALLAKDRAEQAKITEKEAKEEALAAQKESMEIRVDTAPEIVKLARREYKLREYETAFKKASLALKLHPENTRAKFFLSRCLIGKHQFAKALELLNDIRSSESVNEIIKLTQSLIELEKMGPLLEQKELLQIIKGMRSVKGVPGLRTHFLKTCTEIYSEEKRWVFAEAYLRFLTVGEFNFEKSEINGLYSVSLKNNSGMYDVTVLNNLPIYSLDLSGSPVNDIFLLENLPLNELNLSGTNIFDLTPLKDSKLKILNIKNTNVRNIQALTGLPLETLYLNDKWFDVNLLLSFKNLKEVHAHKESIPDRSVHQLNEHFKLIFY